MSIQWDLAAITDPGIHVDHEAAVREIKGEKRHRGEQVRAALYTYRVCYITKTVGPGLGRMAYQEYADELGYAKSYVTNLRRLGRAIVVHGVRPESKLFSQLRNAAVRKEVGQLLDLDVPQPHERLLQVITESEPRATARAGSDPEAAFAEASGVVTGALPSANLEVLTRLEEGIGDLFFATRDARKRLSAQQGPK